MAQIVKNRFNFFELENKPTEKELKEYYSLKYYQEDKGHYQKEYSQEEQKFLINKLEQKFSIIAENLSTDTNKTFLDVGCGEGWALKFFKERKWNVIGLDYSDVGCKYHNYDCVSDILLGDIHENIENLIKENKTFDVIWLDNVLEHVISPLTLLEQCNRLANQGGILVIEVPNDFSVIQHELLNKGHIQKEFWIAIPDHLSYFNKEGLIAICAEASWSNVELIGDFPIDFNLFNPNTNYIDDRSLGKSCHATRVALDNLMHSISIEKTNQFYKALADLGLGRQLIGFFKKNRNV